MAIYRRFLFRSELIFSADMKRRQLPISAFFLTKRYVHTYVRGFTVFYGFEYAKGCIRSYYRYVLTN